MADLSTNVAVGDPNHDVLHNQERAAINSATHRVTALEADVAELAEGPDLSPYALAVDVQSLAGTVGTKAAIGTVQALADVVATKAASADVAYLYSDVLPGKASVSSFDYLESTKQTAAQVDARIAAVVGAAPAALDTLQEIAAALQGDETALTALTNVVAGKASSADVAALTTALAGKADTTALTALGGVVATKADAAATSTALGSKADAAATTSALAGKATTGSVTAVQANVDALAASTTSALAGKATAAAVVAAQADVDALETVVAALVPVYVLNVGQTVANLPGGAPAGVVFRRAAP